MGFRFDLSSLLILNGLLLLLCFVPYDYFSKRLFLRGYRFLFWILNAPFLVFNLGDVEFANFTGRRMTPEIFKMAKAFNTEAFQIIKDYPLFILFLLGLLYSLWWFAPSFSFLIPKRETKFPKIVTGSLLVCLLFALGVRGGVQLKPLQIVHAYTQSSSELSLLSLNTTFTMLKGKSRQQLRPMNYLPSEKMHELSAQFNWNQNYKGPRRKIQNVVLILLESFALEYMGHPTENHYEGFAPFLDSLADRGLYLTNGFANGRRSIEAIPSILCSLPSLMSEGFIASYFQSNQVYCLPQVLKERGYRTGFFHGAENGTMYFDSFAHRIQFDDYYGLNEYPDKKDFDQVWGIYDEPYLQYFKSELDSWDQPFFAMVFTLSSHHPYKVPEVYKSKLPKGSLEIHQSIAYTDLALREFFKSAEDSPWYKNTLFIITGDHTQKSDQPQYANDLGKFRVPFVIFHPDKEIQKYINKRDVGTVFQHVDIFPTIIDYLGFQPQQRSLFGQSLFSSASRWMTNGNEQFFIWYDGETLLKSVGNSLPQDERESSVPIEKVEKAMFMRQSFNHKMLNNQLYSPVSGQ